MVRRICRWPHFSVIATRRHWLLSAWLVVHGTSLCQTTAIADDRLSDQVIVRTIETHLSQVWDDFEITPAARATDLEWCRRTYLNLIGRIPSHAELMEFIDDRTSYKRRRLVDRLLVDDRYSADFARNWATVWTNLLIGRSGGTERNSLTDRDGLYEYLQQSFTENKPYDRMVTELISATGSNRRDSSQFNGATNFLVSKLDENAIQATAKTAQLFLGTQIQCTQCHDHPFNEWKQDQFWQLNSFFRQTVALRRYGEGGMIREVELTDQDFAGEGNDANEADVYFEQRNGILKVAYPVFLDGTPLAIRSGYLDDVHRRRELAQWVGASPMLERALVNRLWKHFFGYGFTDPVDDLGPHRTVTHPELLSALAEQFRSHGFDFRRLLRWIALSEPHALSSRVRRGNEADMPEHGEFPKFSRYYARQMTPEQVYESLLVAAGDHDASGSDAQRNTAKDNWLRQFVAAIDNDEADETSTFNGTIPQTLSMFNGPMVERAIALDTDNLLSTILVSNSKPAAKIEQLYLTALARKPSGQERNLAQQLIGTRMTSGGSVARESNRTPHHPAAGAFQDFYWALLNSNEFLLNH